MPHLCTNCDRTFPDGSKEMLSGCPGCGGNKFQFTPAADRTREATPGADRSDERDGTARASRQHDQQTDHVEESTPDPRSTHWPETARRPAERGIEADEWEDRLQPRDSPTRRDSPPRTDTGDPPGSENETDLEDDVGTAARAEPSIDPGSTAVSERESDPESEGEPVRAVVPEREDDAQASARSDVISPDELPPRTAKSEHTDSQRGSRVAPEQQPPNGTVVSEPETERPSLEELREELNDQFESIKIVNPGQYELNLMELYDREEHIISLQEDGRYVINVPDTWYETDE